MLPRQARQTRLLTNLLNDERRRGVNKLPVDLFFFLCSKDLLRSAGDRRVDDCDSRT